MKAIDYVYMWLILIVIFIAQQIQALNNLTNNDPYPIYTAVYPYDFLSHGYKKADKFLDLDNIPPKVFRLSLTPFRQSASCAKSIYGVPCTIPSLPTGFGLNFGGVFYDPLMANSLASNLGLDISSDGEDQPCFDYIRTPTEADSTHQFGYVSLDSVYRKYGLRLQAEYLLFNRCNSALGLKIQTGVADIRQTIETITDLTCSATGITCPGSCGTTTCPCATDLVASCSCKTLMSQDIIDQKDIVLKTLGYDKLCNTYKKSPHMEDLRILLYFRHTYDLNQEDSYSWPRVLFMPFLEVGGAIPLSDQIDPNDILAIPVGNNDHYSVGMSTGFTLDFLDTVDLAIEGGFTHFFSHKTCNAPLPTFSLENGLFPYKADINVQPGSTWNFGITMNAYHFLDRLSFWIQYMLLSHGQNDIKVCKSYIPDGSVFSPNYTGEPVGDFDLLPMPAVPQKQGFNTCDAQCVSKWEVHMLNLSFTYDISPNAGMGLAWQLPMRLRNAFRSNTVLGTFYLTY